MTSTEMVRASSAIERLPADSNVQAWTPPQKALMQQLGLINRTNWKGPQPDAPAGVVEAFLMQCQRTRLDPAARQIYAAEMGGKWTVLISIDGFRLIADRTGLYLGKQPTLWCGPDGVWRDVWLSDEPPAAAKVAVVREGFTEPLVAVATYAGYCPRDNKTSELKPSGQWKANASNQLAKCAEMLALRQAFPNELSGLYGTEEMDQAKPASAAGGRAGKAAASAATAREVEPAAIVTPKVSRDWAAEARAIEDLGALTQLANEASAAGELGLQVGLAGDNDDGSPLTVMQVLKARKAELEAVPPTLVDVPAGKARARQWTREARLLASRDEVRELWMEARAAKASLTVLDELDTITATLPADEPEAPEAGWAAPGVAEEAVSAWVENPETGDFEEQPMALGDGS